MKVCKPEWFELKGEVNWYGELIGDYVLFNDSLLDFHQMRGEGHFARS